MAVAADEVPPVHALQAIYAEFEPPEGYAQSRGELRTGDRSILNDPFDGRFARQQQFVARLTGRAPEIRNLNPILDELRSVKSPREVALVRKASELAGLGMMEAIRSTEPGVKEYQLEAAARYVFIVNGARLDGYRSITAAGNLNINNMHYYRNADELKDGDWMLMDYAPGLPVLRQRHRPHVAGERHVRALAARAAAVRARVSERGDDAHPARRDDGGDSRGSDEGDGRRVRADEVLEAVVRGGGAHAA